MKKFFSLSFNPKRTFILIALVVFCFPQLSASVSALPSDQRALLNQNVLYFDLGCTPGSVPSGESPVVAGGETTGPPKAVQQIVWDTLTGAEIDAMHTAAVMGNIDHEGVWDPESVEDGHGLVPKSKDPHDAGSYGYGLIGWTPGTRLLDSMEEAKISGKPYTAETQAAVILAHIQGKTPNQYSPDVGKYFLGTKNIEDATTAYQGTDSRKGFENPSDKTGSLPERINAAKRFLRQFGGGVVVDPSAPGSSCVCPGSGGDSPGGSTTLTGKTNAEKIFNYLIDNAGLTDRQAAGAVGSMMLESGGNTLNIDPTAENPSSHAYGIAQWLDSRKTGLENFASDQDGDISDLLIQAQYLVKEMKSNINAFVLKDFQKTKTLEEASKYWTDWFEGLVNSPDQQLHDQRITNGKLVLSNADGTSDGGSLGDPAAASGNCECSTDLVATNLNARLKELSQENGGKTQISVSSINGQIKGDSGGDVQMPTRSSYKVYTAYATLRAIEAGKVSWGTRVSAGSWSGSIKDTMEQMIIYSNNDAAESLRLNRKIGTPGQVTQMLQGDLGLSDKTVMGSGDASDPHGSNSRSTSNDYDKFLILLYKQKLKGVSKDNSYTTLINLMKKASTDNGGTNRDGIAAGVGSGSEVADKPGWAGAGTDQASNDVGIVYLNGSPYVISILTDKPDQWDGVAKIAKEVHSMMGGGSPGGSSGCTGAVPGDLTATVKAYAWPNYSGSRFDPKPEYKKALDDAKAQGQYYGAGYTDCGAFVTRVMIDSGYEPNYNFAGKTSQGAGPTYGGQIDWLKGNWQKVSIASTKDLLPGDVAISDSHTYMYVGILAGFHGNSASASQGGRVPMASDYYEDSFTWYRKK